MRSEKVIMTSRREFLSNSIGIALVRASTWPVRADQARSMHGRSDSSTSNSGRTTQRHPSGQLLTLRNSRTGEEASC